MFFFIRVACSSVLSMERSAGCHVIVSDSAGCCGLHDSLTKKYTDHSKAMAVCKITGMPRPPSRGDYIKPKHASTLLDTFACPHRDEIYKAPGVLAFHLSKEHNQHPVTYYINTFPNIAKKSLSILLIQFQILPRSR